MMFVFNLSMLFTLLFHPVWYSISFTRHTNQSSNCSPPFLPAGGACPQTEGRTGKRAPRFVPQSFAWLKKIMLRASVVLSIGDFCFSQLRLLSITSRLMPASPASNHVCTEFLLPASGPGARHQMWHPGNPLHSDQQQLCTHEPGLVCSFYLWICVTERGCSVSVCSSAADTHSCCKVSVHHWNDIRINALFAVDYKLWLGN